MSEKFSYEKSMDELNAILSDIDDMEVPIDKLVEKVGRGAELLIQCKKKLTDTEMKVNQILNELDREFGDKPEKDKDEE